MKTTHIRRVCAPLLLVLASPFAAAQDFNVKCGAGPIPSPTFGAASGQTGPWNFLGMNLGSTALIDTAGRSTGATAEAVDCDWGDCDACDPGRCPGFSGDADQSALLTSWFNGDCVADLNFKVRSLAPGTYQMHLYVYHGCNPSIFSNIEFRVRDDDGNNVYYDFFQLGGVAFQGTWSGFPVGIRTIDIAPGDYIQVRWGSNFGGACGFQLERLDETGQAFCPGDGTAGACPCANSGGTGRGCQNSATTGGAVLYASGDASLSLDTLSFASAWQLPSAFTIFLQGNASTSAVAFGDGLRCAHGSLKRLFTKSSAFGAASAPVSGDLTVSARSAQAGDTIPAGGTRYYQTYYRDPNLQFCPAPQGSTFNSSTGVVIVWGG